MAKTNPSLTSMTPHAAGERNFVDLHRDNTIEPLNKDLAKNGENGMNGKSASKSVKVFPRKKFHFGNDETQSIADYDPKAHKIGEGVTFANHLRRGKKRKGVNNALALVKKLSGANKGPAVKNESEIIEAYRKDQLGGMEIFHTMNMKKKMDQQMWGKDDATDRDRTGMISFHHAMRSWAARQRVNSDHLHDSSDMKGLRKFSKEMIKRERHKKPYTESLAEKWASDYETPASKKGMWDGYSLEDLHKAAKTAHGTRAKEIDFAIRAKTGWGKVGEGEVIHLTNDPRYTNRVKAGTRISLRGKNAKNEKLRVQADRLGYIKPEDKKPHAVGEETSLPWLKTIVEKKTLTENRTQISDKNFLSEKVALVKKIVEAEGWKYLQYPSHKEAVSARKEHFKNKPSNSCRLMPNGKLAHKGDFGGPKPMGKK